MYDLNVMHTEPEMESNVELYVISMAFICYDRAPGEVSSNINTTNLRASDDTDAMCKSIITSHLSNPRGCVHGVQAVHDRDCQVRSFLLKTHCSLYHSLTQTSSLPAITSSLQ